MALWGNKDQKAVTGTIAVTEDSVNVVGTSTLFLTELDVGNVLDIDGTQYQVASIQTNTALKLKDAYAGDTASGETVVAYEKPAYVQQSELPNIYGISSGEASTLEAKAVGINTPGWGKYTTYTDSSNNVRHKFESLVAMGSVTGDAADDAILPEPGVITIDTQPEDLEVTEGATAEFVVEASITSDSTITYQWQEEVDEEWVDLEDEDADTLDLGVTALADDGRVFRVVVSALGATTVTSDEVTLTVNPE
jgi:hypothetical protein